MCGNIFTHKSSFFVRLKAAPPPFFPPLCLMSSALSLLINKNHCFYARFFLFFYEKQTNLSLFFCRSRLHPKKRRPYRSYKKSLAVERMIFLPCLFFVSPEAFSRIVSYRFHSLSVRFTIQVLCTPAFPLALKIKKSPWFLIRIIREYDCKASPRDAQR